MSERRGTRARILRAGIEHFQASGYHGTGVATILETAEAPKGSFYHHYPGGKEQLAEEAVRWLAAEVSAFLGDLDHAGAIGSAMALAMADYAAMGLEQAPGGRGSLVTVLAAEVAPTVTAVREALSAAIEAWARTLASGAARQGVQDPTKWALGALAQIEGATTLARIANEPRMVTVLVSAWAGPQV